MTLDVTIITGMSGAGRSAAADVLLRLSRLTGEPEYERAGAVPDPAGADSEEFGVILSLLTRSLSGFGAMRAWAIRIRSRSS